MVGCVPTDRPIPGADRRPILPRYAADVAPVIDRVHAGFHQRTAVAFRTSGVERPPQAGILLSLRFAFERRPLPMTVVKAAFRYVPSDEVTAAVTDLSAAGWLRVDQGSVAPTSRTTSWIESLYDLHASVADSWWAPSGVDLATLAALAGRLLTAAASSRENGLSELEVNVFPALSPPYERPGDPAGLVLFNRLAVLRYHRADAHAAAWSAEGLTADQMQALEPGEQRDRIEAETNRLASPPFAVLSEADRQAFLAALRALPVPD
jgi:hypothetical protein